MPSKAINRKGKIVDCLLGQIADHEPGLICPTCSIDMHTRFNRDGYVKHLVHKRESFVCNRLGREDKTYFHSVIQSYFEQVWKAETEKVYHNLDGEIVHRADIVLPNNVVIEVQHSPIKGEVIADREFHYGDRMIWLLSKAHFGVVSVEKMFKRDGYRKEKNFLGEDHKYVYPGINTGEERFFVDNNQEFYSWQQSQKPIYFVDYPDDVSVNDEYFWVNSFENDSKNIGMLPVYKIIRLADFPVDPIFTIKNYSLVGKNFPVSLWVRANKGFIVAEKLTLEQLARDLLNNQISFNPTSIDSIEATRKAQKRREIREELLEKRLQEEIETEQDSDKSVVPYIRRFQRDLSKGNTPLARSTRELLEGWKPVSKYPPFFFDLLDYYGYQVESKKEDEKVFVRIISDSRKPSSLS